jgi:hypothetical protein
MKSAFNTSRFNQVQLIGALWKQHAWNPMAEFH